MPRRSAVAGPLGNLGIIPNELLVMIAWQVSEGDLLNLALTHSAFTDIAIELLYKKNAQEYDSDALLDAICLEPTGLTRNQETKCHALAQLWIRRSLDNGGDVNTIFPIPEHFLVTNNTMLGEATILFLAAARGNISAVQYLISRGADVNIPADQADGMLVDRDDATPGLEYLCDHQSIKFQHGHLWRPLLIPLALGYRKIVEVLLEAGSSLDLIECPHGTHRLLHNLTALQAVSINDPMDFGASILARTLATHPDSLDQPLESPHHSALGLAIAYRHASMVRQLLAEKMKRPGSANFDNALMEAIEGCVSARKTVDSRQSFSILRSILSTGVDASSAVTHMNIPAVALPVTLHQAYCKGGSQRAKKILDVLYSHIASAGTKISAENSEDILRLTVRHVAHTDWLPASQALLDMLDNLDADFNYFQSHTYDQSNLLYAARTTADAGSLPLVRHILQRGGRLKDADETVAALRLCIISQRIRSTGIDKVFDFSTLSNFHRHQILVMLMEDGKQHALFDKFTGAPAPDGVPVDTMTCCLRLLDQASSIGLWRIVSRVPFDWRQSDGRSWWPALILHGWASTRHCSTRKLLEALHLICSKGAALPKRSLGQQQLSDYVACLHDFTQLQPLYTGLKALESLYGGRAA